MSPLILDGKWLAKLYQNDIHAEVVRCQEECSRVPGLAVILVGENPASQAYVKRKEKIATQCGFQTFDTTLPETATASDVEAVIEKYNDHEQVDGILLQLPLPKQLSSETNRLIGLIDPAKDVDGLHPYNQGLLLRGEGVLRSCTPLGVMKLIDLALSDVQPRAEGISTNEIPKADLAGKKAIVIGRSVLVGKPVSFLLLEQNATVVMAHSKTKDLDAVVRDADIVVAAVGIPHLVKGSWVKEGSVVIDVGINRLESGVLTGDVDYEEVAPRSSAITPVPGGVGQMTVAMLMLNTLLAFKEKIKEFPQ